MPNTLYFSSGAGVLRGYKSFLWNVPVDDESHMMFFLFIAAHLPPESEPLSRRAFGTVASISPS